MTETFKQLKKKYTTIAIIISVIVGVFCALFAVGAVMLGIKLGAERLAVYYYVIIGVGAFLIAGGVTFLFTRHTDKSLSKKLDSEYGLNEKVQTMVEFAGESGDMLALQRADADEKLKNLPKQKLTFAKIWQYVLVAVIGLSVFLSGLLVSSRYVAPEPPVNPDDYVLNEWDAKSLDQLIADVKASELKDEVMLPVVTALEVLKSKLPDVKTNKEMRDAVTNCAKTVETAIMYANTYRDVAIVLNSYRNQNIISLKIALINACASYKSDDIEINSMSTVKNLQKTSESKIRTALSAFTQTVVPGSGVLKAEIYNTIIEFLDELNVFINQDENEELTERIIECGLYGALLEYSENLGDVYDYEWWSESYLNGIVSEANAIFTASASKELVTQVYNHMINDMIFNRLEDIFDIVLTHEDWDLPDIPEDGDGDSKEDSSSGGGGSDGDSKFGSDAEVYDHVNNKNVPYGEIWSDYKSELLSRVQNDSDLSEEMKKYIEKYIEYLDGSNDTETGENNN